MIMHAVFANKPDRKLSGSGQQSGQRPNKGLFTIAIECLLSDFVFVNKALITA